MKEIELDKYVGKNVEVTDFEKEKYDGVLLKIKDGIAIGYPINDYLCSIKDGYMLMRTNGNYLYRKSHIKKIREICKGECL